MIALTVFIISLLLAVEALEPAAPWLVTLAVLSGVEALRPRRSLPRLLKGSWPEVIALSVFIIALLLAIEALEPTAPWLVALAVLSGIQAFRPRWFSGRRPFRRHMRAWAATTWGDDPWSGEDDW